jgi:hypothetical protein
MNTSVHRQREPEPAHSLLCQATVLLDKSRALDYVLVMALAYTTHEDLSHEEVDGLCQLAYELLNKLAKTQEILHETRQTLFDATPAR